MDPLQSPFILASVWKVATWNVNSVNARIERLLAFLDRESPDVVLLQELKCELVKFPQEAIAAKGYVTAVAGQKTYNGVAILSKTPITEIVSGLGDPSDPQARFIMGCVRGVQVASAYVPNGQAVGTEKYAYKLDWFKRLKAVLSAEVDPMKPFVLGGDFNVAPEDRDVHDPEAWRGQILFSEPEKAALKSLCDIGLHDTFRKFHSDSQFSWWDYRMLAFPKNKGLRIDFLLASAPLYEMCKEARIDRDERKGSVPSDHAPVLATFKI